jgi:type IV secretion system protein VirB6
MGFFATFWSWLNGQLTTYISDNTARLASTLEPAIVTFATLYIMGWGYLHLLGKIDEPVVAGLKRIAVVALVLGMGLQLWLYNSVIVDSFYRAPAQLAAAMVGSGDPVGTIDTIWDNGGAVAGNLWSRSGGIAQDVGFYLAGAIVWCLIGALCVYAMFLIALSSVALAVLLALGPLFIAMLFFEPTKRLFVAWLMQLANYALITILTVMIAALMLRIVQSYAEQTAARGATILTVDALNLVLVAVLVFLMMRQVMPIASGLVGGASLVSYSVISRGAGWGMRQSLRAAKPAAKGMVAAGRVIGTAARGTRQYVASQTQSGAAALSRSWRKMRD